MQSSKVWEDDPAPIHNIAASVFISEWWLHDIAQGLLFQVGRQLQNLYLSSIVQVSLAICQLTVLVMQTIHKLQQYRPETAADVQS